MGIFDFFKPKREKDLIAEGSWSIAEGKDDGLPIIYRYRSGIPNGINESNYPNMISIVWQYDEDENQGMPSEDTNAMQTEFDNALDAIGTGEIGVLMIAITGNNQKEWIWYVKDTHNWMNQMVECLNGHPQYPLNFEHHEEKTWDTYKLFIQKMTK